MISCTVLWFLASVLVCASLHKKCKSTQHPQRDDYVCYRALTWFVSMLALSVLMVQVEGSRCMTPVMVLTFVWFMGSWWLFYINQEDE